MLSKLLLNKRYIVSIGIVLGIFVLMACTYFAGMNSGVEALSTNSDLTVTETVDGYAIHEPNDSWVYGRDPYIELIPYTDEDSEEYPDENQLNNIEENTDNENYGNEDVWEDTEPQCGIGYDLEKGNIEVVQFNYDNETGQATYVLYDYSTDLTFTVVLNHYGVVEAY